MIQEGKNLYADDGKYLYAEESENIRNFWKSVTLPTESDIKWYEECTTAEKEQWEREHPQPESIEEVEVNE